MKNNAFDIGGTYFNQFLEGELPAPVTYKRYPSQLFKRYIYSHAASPCIVHNVYKLYIMQHNLC